MSFLTRLLIVLATLTLIALAPAIAVAQSDSPPRSIFDGQTLEGWSGDESFWRVEEGAIVAESTPENPCLENTFLLWNLGDVDDFELRLMFRITGSESANSGIQFRGSVREDGHVIGYQADIDKAGQWIGAIYDEGTSRRLLAGRGEQTHIIESGERKQERFATAEALDKHIRPDDWNEYVIRAEGEHITLAINGHQTAEVVDRQTGEKDLIGKLALQLHSGPPMKVEFKDIRLKRLPLAVRRKVVFIAGTRSHGYFAHEHRAGCLLLADRLNRARADQGLPVVATVYTEGWPKDPSALDNVDTVVCYCDGGGGHYLNNRLEEFDELMSRGVGLVCIHYAVEVPKGPPGDHFLKWLGGYFEPFWSVNPHWTANFKELPQHPITRGVSPFEINDEWYYHMRFQPEMQGVTPILTDLPPRETLNRQDGHHSGNPFVREAVLQRQEPQHVAWAFERPEGGRGFGFTGGHNHINWQDDNFRKTVLNAIVWTSGADVPVEGVRSATPSQAEMEANQDFPKPGEAKNEPRRRRDRRTDRAVATATSAAFLSPVVTSRTPGHAVSLEVPVQGQKKLVLVATDGGDGYGCDWCDWAEPRLVGPDGEMKLTDLPWTSARTDWGQVRVGRNAGGGPLRIEGNAVSYGIGAHANSVIEFDLPEGHNFTHFKATAGLDNGGTDQAEGRSTSVQFHVFTQVPDPAWLAQLTEVRSSSAGSHELQDAIDQLDVHPELEVSLFAGEPLLRNPTNIDIDPLGRVWVCEVVNYRRFRNTDMPAREEGDRILILEDTNRDGRADVGRTFYQGRDVDSAHGILVLPTEDGRGTKALISCQDRVFYLIDDDGDLRADRQEVLFTGLSGAEHDHGIHAFVFGPDGKLYFNFGNEGRQIKDAQGRPIIDKAGNEVNNSRNPYQEGMAFRCNLDGSGFETLGWNFRNNWELAVDSFGTIWQSDNDDDGNRGTRINYVMEFGNYGYKDEMTGAGWREPRTGWSDEIPLRHWHLNDPGVVPNLLQTGAGSPTGICVYEGHLLPEVFRNQIIHCDAGPNVVRAYPVTRDGAGFRAEIVDVLVGTRDQWFRPSDVCVAPDGSLLVADWYDPGVGGHRMQDVERGRLFRLTPRSSGLAGQYSVPKVDVSTADGAVKALQSPNAATRYLAWTALQGMGHSAQPALQALWQSADPRLRARAVWLLAKLDISSSDRLRAVRSALQDDDADLRITGIRLARQLAASGLIDVGDIQDAIDLRDPSPQVRREVLLGLREADLDEMPVAWSELALQYDGQDRWYLEALGISAEGRWDQCLDAWKSSVGSGWKSKAGRDITWRSRGEKSAEMLGRLILDPQTPVDELPRYFRAFDFQDSARARPVLENLTLAERSDPSATAFMRGEAFARLQGVDVRSRPDLKRALDAVLAANEGTEQFLKLVDTFSAQDRYPDLLAMAQRDPVSQRAVDAIRILLNKRQMPSIREALRAEDPRLAESTLAALGSAADPRTVNLLLEVMKDEERALDVRRAAVKAAGQVLPGAQQLLKLAEDKTYDPLLESALAAALHTSQWRSVQEPALKLFPLPPGKDSEPLPPIADMSERQGDADRGRVLFHSTATCNKCHIVNTMGRDVGPDLSEIGKKLSKPAMYESILYPSAGISHNYESWTVVTNEGQVVTGLLVSETPDEIKLKDINALVHTIPATDIELKKNSEISLMPADLQKILSANDLVDIVEYMRTLTQRTQP